MDDFMKISLVDHDTRMFENDYKRLLYLLADAVMHFALTARPNNIAAKTRYSPVLAHTAVVCASKVD